MKRFCLLGSSRGLGWGTYLALAHRYPKAEFFLVSRKIQGRSSELKPNTQVYSCDFSKSSADELIPHIQKFQPTDIIYFAAGGPYGDFFNSSWDSHQWSLKVTFLFPAELILKTGQAVAREPELWPNLRSMIVIGSSIAENAPDPMAASYCAAKHALKGLISTLQTEKGSQFQIKMFSPGYIATDLLPKNSAPRKDGRAQSVESVASELISFIE